MPKLSGWAKLLVLAVALFLGAVVYQLVTGRSDAWGFIGQFLPAIIGGLAGGGG